MTPPRRFFRRPRGYIDWPRPGELVPRAPAQFIGWCLFPGASVARVEVSVNDGPPERARLGMERPDIEERAAHPAAPIAGFEHKADLTLLPPGTGQVVVEAVAHSTDGRTLRLEPVTFSLTEPKRTTYDSAHAAELRARAVAPLRHPRAHESGIRLLAFTHMLVHGGGSLYLLELVTRLHREPGIECHVVTLADGPLRPELERRGIPVHVTDGFPLDSMQRYEGHMAELVAWAAASGFNAVLANTLGSFAGADLATRLGAPCVWAVHESFALPMFWHTAYMPGALHPYPRERAEQAFRSAAAVVFEAEATRRLFLEDTDPARLLTLPYGIELGDIDAARGRQAARARKGRTLLCLGTIEPRKSQAMLAAAFARVAERHPDARLVLVGETDDAYCAAYVAALREYIRRAGLGRRVLIEPVTDDPYSWHAAADVLVCASDVESLPRSIMEAMAFGTPVLSTRVFGVTELIEDGTSGYLCEMRDLDDLAAALDRVLGAPEAELRQVAHAGSERVRERHDPERYAAQIATLVKGLVRNPDALPADLLAEPPSERAASDVA